MTARGVALLAAALLAVVARPVAAAELTCPAPDGASCEKADVGFTPAYPDPAAMPDYATFTATLPGLGYLKDLDDDGSVSDERCDANMEAGLGEAVAVMKTIAAGSVLCDALPENVDIGCYVALSAVATAAQSAATVAAQCRFQDGLVDGAEAEATYENTKLVIVGQLEASLDRCIPLGTLMLPHSLGGRAEEVRDLVRRRIDQMRTLGQTPDGVARAEDEQALGEARLAAGEYHDAFVQFCRAYKQLQLAHR
jgi:hypothetical protein